MRYKQPLSHLETYDCNFQPHNPFQMKMPRDLEEKIENDGTSPTLEQTKLTIGISIYIYV